MQKNIYCRLFIIFICMIFLSCAAKDSTLKSKKTESLFGKRKKMVSELNTKVDDISTYISKNDSLIKLLSEKNLEYENLIVFLNDKIESVDQKITYIDSVNLNISYTLNSFQDEVETISKSYNEISQITFKDTIDEISPINDEEFKKIYIESLAFYQNAEWEKSLNGFQYLLSTGNINMLLDNCQYWLGETFFKMRKYHNAIDEFNKVFLYLDSNKRDDSLYKLAKCYMLLEDEVKANESLISLVEKYPNSEYVKKAQQILK